MWLDAEVAPDRVVRLCQLGRRFAVLVLRSSRSASVRPLDPALCMHIPKDPALPPPPHTHKHTHTTHTNAHRYRHTDTHKQTQTHADTHRHTKTDRQAHTDTPHPSHTHPHTHAHRCPSDSHRAGICRRASCGGRRSMTTRRWSGAASCRTFAQNTPTLPLA